MKEIYYQYEDEIEAPASDVTVDVPITATPATPVISFTAVSTPSSESVASMEDVLIKAINIVTQKLKKRLDEIPLSKSIKDLVGGKSTLQNEILGDLQQEFALAPEKGEELPQYGVLFLVSLEAKCLVVSIRRLSRAISARARDYVPLVLMVFFSLEPLSNLPNDLLPKRKGRVGLMALFLFTLSVLASP